MNTSLWQHSSKRKVVALVVLLALLAGGTFAYVTLFANPPSVWVVKHRIARHLKRESHQSDFSTDFKFPTRAEMNTPAPPEESGTSPERIKGIGTGKSFEALRNEYMDLNTELLVVQRELAQKRAQREKSQAQIESLQQKLAAAQQKTKSTAIPVLSSNLTALRATVAKLDQELAAGEAKVAANQTAMEPLLRDLREIQRTWQTELEAASQPETDEFLVSQDKFMEATQQQLEQAPTYAAIYRLIGQELWVADRLFESKNVKHQRAALNLSRKARRDALDFAVDAWLAARICEAYLRPHLDIASTYGRRSRVSFEGLADECARTFQDAEEPENVVTHYKWLMHTTSEPRRVDWARVRLSESYMREGDFKQAIAYLKQIQLTNDYSWALRRLPWLEQRAKNQ